MSIRTSTELYPDAKTVHTVTPYFREIRLILFSHLRLGYSGGSFSCHIFRIKFCRHFMCLLSLLRPNVQPILIAGLITLLSKVRMTADSDFCPSLVTFTYPVSKHAIWHFAFKQIKIFWCLYCIVHHGYIMNTKFPTYMHNAVLFRRVSA